MTYENWQNNWVQNGGKAPLATWSRRTKANKWQSYSSAHSVSFRLLFLVFQFCSNCRGSSFLFLVGAIVTSWVEDETDTIESREADGRICKEKKKKQTNRRVLTRRTAKKCFHGKRILGSPRLMINLKIKMVGKEENRRGFPAVRNWSGIVARCLCLRVW